MNTMTTTTPYRSLTDEQLAAELAELEQRFDALDGADSPGIDVLRNDYLTEILAARLEITRRRT